MKRVLVAIDGSTHADAAVRWLVEEATSRGPVLAHLLNVQPAPIGYQTHGLETEAIAKLAQQRGAEVLRPAVQVLDAAKVPTSARRSRASPGRPSSTGRRRRAAMPS